MAYHALKLLQLPPDLINEIISYLAPTPEQLRLERLNHELLQKFVNYDIIYSIPFMRKLGVKFRYSKHQIFACLAHDLGFELDDFSQDF
jgi:hypothetical protein